MAITSTLQSFCRGVLPSGLSFSSVHLAIKGIPSAGLATASGAGVPPEASSDSSYSAIFFFVVLSGKFRWSMTAEVIKGHQGATKELIKERIKLMTHLAGAGGP